MFQIVLRQAAMGVIVLGMGLGGCMGLRPDTIFAGAPSSSPPPAAARAVAEVGFEDSDDSDLKEFAPWRASPRPVAARAGARTAPAEPEMKVASARRGVVDAAAAPEVFPEDPEELKLWLGRRSERAAETHRANVDRLQKLEQQSAASVNGICSGC